MKQLKALLWIGMAVTSVSHAKQHLISVETFSYPSPAAVHLDLVQQALAHKARETCGDDSRVGTLSSIAIEIKGAREGSAAARLRPDQAGLDLWYPRIKATATVNCAN